jgi:hypothetical protein
MPLAVAKLREASRFSIEEPDSYRGIRSGRVFDDKEVRLLTVQGDRRAERVCFGERLGCADLGVFVFAFILLMKRRAGFCAVGMYFSVACVERVCTCRIFISARLVNSADLAKSTQTFAALKLTRGHDWRYVLPPPWRRYALCQWKLVPNTVSQRLAALRFFYTQVLAQVFPQEVLPSYINQIGIYTFDSLVADSTNS